MTRINLLHPNVLTNRHLVAEYTEIRHIPKALKRSINSVSGVYGIPLKFTLGSGHVKFFFDKGKYIVNRFESIKDEMIKRGFNLSPDKLDLDGKENFLLGDYNHDYVPTDEAIWIVSQRIFERINLKPHLYPDSDRFFAYFLGLDIKHNSRN